jgi:hypothetical protein
MTEEAVRIRTNLRNRWLRQEVQHGPIKVEHAESYNGWTGVRDVNAY